jgi:hypothetical protein
MVSASHVRLAPVGFAGSSQETSKLSSLQYCMVTTYMIMWERWHALHCCKTFIEPQPHNPIIKSDCIYLYIYISKIYISRPHNNLYIPWYPIQWCLGWFLGDLSFHCCMLGRCRRLHLDPDCRAPRRSLRAGASDWVLSNFGWPNPH